jgi:hypothetical protein
MPWRTPAARATGQRSGEDGANDEHKSPAAQTRNLSSMFESTSPFLLFDYFRVPYELSGGAPAEVAKVSAGSNSPFLSWPAADALAASGTRTGSFYLGSIPIFGRVACNAQMGEWMVTSLSRARERLSNFFRIPTPAWDTVKYTADKRLNVVEATTMVPAAEVMVQDMVLGNGRTQFSYCTFDGFPRLTTAYESSVRRLYFVGAAAARMMGPGIRFVSHSGAAAGAVAQRGARPLSAAVRATALLLHLEHGEAAVRAQ